MFVSRVLVAVTLGAAGFSAAPAAAQFYLRAPELASPRITGTEPGMLAQPLPGATPAELRAAMVWNLRAALNVAALQCQFAPTLRPLPNYNAILSDHRAELADSYTVLAKYFARSNKSTKAGQDALDRYGTRVYSSYSAVHAQLTFCQAADALSNQAVFTPRGRLGDLAAEQLGVIRNSLTRWGEQQFPMVVHSPPVFTYPKFGEDKCWRKGVYTPERCTPKKKR